MDGSLEDLKRRFIEKAESAEPLDSELGRELLRLLVTHEWFTRQLHNLVRALVLKWGGNREDVKEMEQDVVLQLRLDMDVNPTLGLDLERARTTFPAWINGIIHKLSVDLAASRFGHSLPVERGAEPNQVASRYQGFEDVDLQSIGVAVARTGPHCGDAADGRKGT